MGTIEYKSELTTERIMRKHNKDSMARNLFDTYFLLKEIREAYMAGQPTKLSLELMKRLDNIQTRIAWG